MKRWLFILTLTLSACATTAGATQPGAATLSLSLARSDGRTIGLDAYAGKPLLLLLFATYDQASALALQHVTELAKEDSSLQIAGVLVQPEAATFLPLFSASVQTPFALYDEPQQRLLKGESALGPLQGVPAFVVLDATGQLRDVHYGDLKVPEIKQLLSQ